jgi:hypothetical protein
MDENNSSVDSVVRIKPSENVRIILEDPPEGRGSEPLSVDIMLRERPEGPERQLAHIRIIHEEELSGVRDVHSRRFTVEDESMTFGEAVTLLIALGVLSYLLYALL